MNNRRHPRKRVEGFTRKQWIIALVTMTFAFLLGSALTLLPYHFMAHASGASITVTPKSAAYSNQTSITVSGSSYAPNETVKIYWNYTGPGTGTLESTVTASATGTFQARFRTPLTSTGTYTVAAIGQSSGSVATGTTQILPQMYLSPRASGSGTNTYFFGNAFGANEQVKIYWNYTGPGTGSLITTASANSTGSFNVTGRIPSGTAAGTIPVVGIGQTSNTSASFNFILYPPLLTLAPLSGSAGTTETVSAYGFQAFEKVSVFWNNGSTAVASAPTSQYGYLSPITFTVPAGTAPGNYPVKVVGAVSKLTITNTFSVIAAGSALSSASGPVASNVTISGYGYAPGEKVNVQWGYTGPGTGNTIATTTTGLSGAFTTSFTVPTAANAVYAVAAVGQSSQSATQSSFTISKSVAANPATTSPGATITLTGTGYQALETVQVYLDGNAGNVLATPTADAKGNISTSLSIPTSLTPGSHSITGTGQTSSQSFTTPLTIDTSWGDFGYSLAHHRQNFAEYGVGSGNVNKLQLRWTASTALKLRSSPVYASGIVYLGTHDGKLKAYNATTGNLVWTFDSTTNFEVPSAPLVDPANNLVFFGTMGFEDSGIPSPFYALDATTGQLKWSVILPWNNFGFPSLAFKTIYIGASHEGGTAMLNALDEITGHIQWQHATNGGVWGAVAADPQKNTVFTGVGNPDDQVLSLNATTGALNWTFPVPNSGPDDDAGSGIMVSNGLVYVDSKNGTLYALHESDGTLAWTTPVGPPNVGNVSSPAIGANGTLYVGSMDNNLYAINATTGAVLWKTPTGAGIDSSPAVSNKVVYVASLDKSIYALNTTSGAILWHYATSASSYSSPIIVNGWLYCASTDGNLYAFSL